MKMTTLLKVEMLQFAGDLDGKEVRRRERKVMNE